MALQFRKLNATEIDVRVATVKDNGVSLLLYKDARVDQSILDETVSPFGWQRDHKELKGVIYCGIGIWNNDLRQWVWKWDAGAESFSDKEKGEASDSFKRAGFNWGIGRELYTSPFIWVNNSGVSISKKGNGFTTYDRFKVKEITYSESGEINGLVIVNSKTNKVVFNTKGKTETSEELPEKKQEKATPKQIADFKLLVSDVELLKSLEYLKVKDLKDADKKTLQMLIDRKKKAIKEVDITEQEKTLKEIGEDK